MIRRLPRICLFISSYTPLIIIIMINSSFDPLWLNLILGIVALLSVLIVIDFIRLARNIAPVPFPVDSVSSRNEDAAAYLIAYILPFLEYKLTDWRGSVSLLIIFLVLMIIYVNTDRIFINPMFNLLNYHLFEVSSQSGNKFILITKRTDITPGMNLNVAILGKSVMVEVKNAMRTEIQRIP